MFLNPLAVESPYWKREWLAPEAFTCRVHRVRLTTLPASKARNGINMPKLILLEERRGRGKALRDAVPRASQAGWKASKDRGDPVEIVSASNQGRMAQLIPIRFGRMSASPFAFYRGAAALMAADLATTPASGIRVQACGDAHLMNSLSHPRPPSSSCGRAGLRTSCSTWSRWKLARRADFGEPHPRARGRAQAAIQPPSRPIRGARPG